MLAKRIKVKVPTIATMAACTANERDETIQQRDNYMIL